MGILGKIAERIPVRCRSFDDFASQTGRLDSDYAFSAVGYIKVDPPCKRY